MFTKPYWIHTFESGGRLGIMARPRGNDWLAGEIERWEEMGITTVVSLLEKDEIQELGLAGEESLCRQHRIEYINFAIKDRGVPADGQAADRLIKRLAEKMDGGEKVTIHCRMGIGRASLIAGAVLVAKGAGAQSALQQITKVRELKVPDTNEQVLWLKRLEKSRRENQSQ
jgi:protein-tyrosine phosphatase